ncbi:hypothetical protein D3C75_1182730 [compost metagenome]
MVSHRLGRFGRAVEVDADGVGGDGADLLVQGVAQGIPAPEQVAQVIELQATDLRPGFNEFAQGRREVNDGDSVLVYPFGQCGWIDNGRLGRDHDLCANGQRREHVPVDRIVTQP